MQLIRRPGVTHAGDLGARFVIHTVVPADEAKLGACYRAALNQAAALDCRSVAVPALGAGAEEERREREPRFTREPRGTEQVTDG